MSGAIFGLYLAGLALGLVEFFLLPGFGVAGILSLLALAGHVGLLVTTFPAPVALGVLAAEMVLAGGATYVAIQALPHTALGELVIQKKQLKGRAPALPAFDPDLWVGKRGVAVGSLRPAGTVRIENAEHPAKGRGLIDPDTPVEVVAVDGSTLVVAPIDEQGKEGRT